MADQDIRLPDTSKLVVSTSPHFHDDQNVRGIMLTVIVALLPACAAGVWFFGPRALLVLAVCALSSVFFEWLISRQMKLGNPIGDCSAFLTGLLLGMNLSAGTPVWICVVGSLLAIGLGKMIYGGLGYNPFNPALVGRVGLLIACPVALTTWVKPLGLTKWVSNVDGMTTATPLGVLGMVKQWDPAQVMDGLSLTPMRLFLGQVGGCLGETSALALLIGGLYLIKRGIIRWQTPVAFIGTVLIVTGIAHAADPTHFAPPWFHLLTGGLFLGAFFMATDMVTSPMNPLGNVVFGIGCGLVTCVIRLWGAYPEGVSFSILFMNALVPLIDRTTATRPFGYVRPKEEASE
jgi:electron transport complex protein RnfD